MRIEESVKLDFSDVLIRPKRSTLISRKDVDLNREFKFLHSGLKWKGIPIIASNMDGVGTFEMALELAKFNAITAFTKHIPKYLLNDWLDDEGLKIKNNWAYSIGLSQKDMSSFDSIVTYVGGKNEFANRVHFLCVDVANGYTETFVDFIKKTRDDFPTLTIIAGNVVTAEMTEELLLSGADIVKIGIGSGGACLTRVVAGVGYPQLSAIIECADAAHGLKGHIISDGGCSSSGDVSKAFAAGADFVMLGSMLAGHNESGFNIIEENGKKYVKFYGMSSSEAMTTHYGEMANHRTSEGRIMNIPYKGSVSNTMQDILGGIRSACTYVGAENLKNLSKCTTFVRVNNTHNRTYENYTIGK